MHFFAKKCIFLLSGRGKPLLFRVLEVDGVFLTQVFDYFGWKKLGSGTHTIGFEKGAVGLQLTAKGLRTDTRRAGKFGFSARTHRMCDFLGFQLLTFYLLLPKELRRNSVKKCLEWHFEYCVRRVPTLRIKRNT